MFLQYYYLPVSIHPSIIYHFILQWDRRGAREELTLSSR